MASAGSFFSVYRIDLGQFTADISSAKQQLTDLRAFAAQPTTIGAGASAGAGAGQAALGALQGPQQQTADGALRLAQAEARLAAAMGEPARAAGTLSAALQQNAGASDRATLSVQTQVARLQSGTGIVQQFGASFKSSLLGIVGPAAAAGLAIGAVRAAMGAAEEGFKLQASLDASRQSIDLLLAGVRDSGQVWAGAARFAAEYKLTQQETTEAIQASVRIIRTSKAPIEDVLGAFARLKVLAPEKTFSDASRALSELQAGQVVSIEHLFNVPRRDANEMKKAIEGGADAVTVLNRYLDKTGVTMDAVKAQSSGAAGEIKDAAVAAERLQLALGGGSGGAGLTILQAKTRAVTGLTNVLSGQIVVTKDSASAFDHYAASVLAFSQAALSGNFTTLLNLEERDAAAKRQQADAAQLMAGAQAGVSAATQAASVAAQQHAHSMEMETERITASQSALALHAAGMREDAAAAALSAQFAQQAAQAQLAQANSAELAGVQARAAAEADRLKSNADQVGAVDAQTHAIAMQQLAAQAQTAANRLLATGAQGAAAAAQLANSSQQVDVMTAALYRLAAAQAAARLATLNTARTSAGFTDQRDIGAYKGAGLAQQRDQEKAAALAAAEAERQYQKEIGNFGPTLARARADLAQLGRDRGTNSAEYINQLTKIHQLEEQSASASKKGRAGAGAAHLSDQAKLNNSLLANQESADHKLEDLDRQHEQKLLDIEREFQRKSLEQQRQNEVSKRQSRADFYDSLTSSSKDLGQKESQALSAEYESAYAKAQAIAQAGNQKLANDYLAMRQRQIQQEIEYQKARAAAAKDGDKGEVARLDAIQKLRTDAQREEEQQLLAGGDPNAKARDDAIAQEGTRYGEAQDKIVTAADRTATAKVVAAERAGKAIDVENLKLKEQADYYDRIRARTGVPSGASAGVAPEVATPTLGTGAAPTPAPAGGEQLWRVFDSAVVDAINAQTERLSRDLTSIVTTMQDVGKRVSSVESAVRGLAGKALQ